MDAKRKIPDELYFVPKNLAIKAEIMARLGNVKTSSDLYEKAHAGWRSVELRW